MVLNNLGIQLSRTPREGIINWEYFWDQAWKWQKSGVNKQADSGDNSIQKTGEIINSSVNSVSNTSEKTGLKESASRENKPNVTFTFGSVKLLHARHGASLTENININKQLYCGWSENCLFVSRMSGGSPPTKDLSLTFNVTLTTCTTVFQLQTDCQPRSDS